MLEAEQGSRPTKVEQGASRILVHPPACLLPPQVLPQPTRTQATYRMPLSSKSASLESGAEYGMAPHEHWNPAPRPGFPQGDLKARQKWVMRAEGTKEKRGIPKVQQCRRYSKLPSIGESTPRGMMLFQVSRILGDRVTQPLTVQVTEPGSIKVQT